MDVLTGMFRVAESACVLANLMGLIIKHRISLYVDDVVIFAKPDPSELNAVRTILECFGGASGLHVNFAKSSAVPIRFPEDTLAAAAPSLACPIKELQCTYLGLCRFLSSTRGTCRPSLITLVACLPIGRCA
jgi:hypothetical protein